MPSFRRRGLTFTVRPGPEFRRVARQLAVENEEMPDRVRRILRRNAQEMADRARAKVRRLPTRGSKHTGLRRRIASGVRVVDTPGGGVRITTSMRQADESYIPRGMDSPKGWRHPVFGNREVWVRQRPIRPYWFTGSMGDQRDDIERDLDDAMEGAADRIAEEGNTRGLPG